MEGKETLEGQVKALQKHFAGVARVVKDMKSQVEAIEQKLALKDLDAIREIIDAQKVVDEILVDNSNAMKMIDRELKELKKIEKSQQI